MRVVKLCIFLFASLIVCSSSAQKRFSMTNKEALRKLDDGWLLIKLNSKQSKIDSLSKYNFNTQANKVRVEVETVNNEVKAGFKEYYDYSKYCYFNSHDSRSIIVEQDYSKLISCHDKGEQLASVVPDSNIFFLFLEPPNWYASPDNDFFILYGYKDKSIFDLKKVNRRTVFSTDSKWFLFRKRDIKESIKRLNESWMKSKK